MQYHLELLKIAGSTHRGKNRRKVDFVEGYSHRPRFAGIHEASIYRLWRQFSERLNGQVRKGSQR